MAVDQCDDLITSLLFHNTNFQPSILIYCFLRDGAENEVAVSQQLNTRAGLLLSVTFTHQRTALLQMKALSSIFW